MGRSFSIKPLHSLVASNCVERVRTRLYHCPQAPYQPTSAGNLPIHCAATSSNAKIVALLLDVAPDTADARNAMGDTPLHCAAYHANDAAVDVLVRRGHAALVAPNLAGDTPLMAATRAGHTSTVRRLLDAAPCSILLPNAKGETPLHAATALYVRAHTRAARDLALVLLARQHPDPDDAALRGLLGTLLATAAALGHATLVARVLALDASLATSPGAGTHPVKLAAQGGHADVLDALLAVAPELATLEDTRGVPPMQHAILGAHLAAVRALLRAAPHAATHVPTAGVAPLVVAVQRGESGLAIVRALLHAAPHAADVTARGVLPVHYAVAVDNREAVQAILEAAPHTAGTRDARGYNALHYAIKFASPRAAAVVLAHAPHLAADDRCMELAMALRMDVAALLRPLLAAAPSLATIGWLQRMVERDLPDSVAEMLATAPHLVQQADAQGRTPMDAAINAHATRSALVLASARHPDPVLLFLQLATFGAPADVFVRAIQTHVPLPPQCWDVVPAPLPGLLAALPHVLVRGREDDVERAVAHMAPADQQFLRDSVRALHGLPPDLTRQILCMAV